MKRKLLIILCSMLLGFGITGCLSIPCGLHAVPLECKQEEPVRMMAWWSLMYERPNPDRLPVEVKFQWLGLQRMTGKRLE